MSSPRETPDIAHLTEAYNFALYGHGDGDGIVKYELTTNQVIFWLEQNCYAKSFINIHYTSASIIAKLTELTTDKNYHTAFLAHMALCRIHFHLKNSKQALLHCKKAKEKLERFKRTKEIFNIPSELPTTQILIELHKLAAITPTCLAHEEYIHAAKLGDVDSALLVAEYFRLNHFNENAKDSIVMYCKQALNNALATRNHQVIFETKSRLNSFLNHSSDPSLYKILNESQTRDLIILITDPTYDLDSPRVEHKSEQEKSSKKILNEKFSALEKTLEDQVKAEHQAEIDELEAEIKYTPSAPADMIEALAVQLKIAAENKNEKRIEVVEERLLNFLKSLVDSQDEAFADTTKILPEKHILLTDNTPSFITSRSKIFFELMCYLGEHPRPSYQIYILFKDIYQISLKCEMVLPRQDSDFLLESYIKTLKILYFNLRAAPDLKDSIKAAFNRHNPLWSDHIKNAVTQMQKYYQCEDDEDSIFQTYLKEQMRANFIPALHFYDTVLENSKGLLGKQHVISRLLVCTKLLCLTHDIAAATHACGLPASEIIKMRTSAEALLARCKNPDDSIYSDRTDETRKQECVDFAIWCNGVQLEVQCLKAKFDDKNNIDECLVQAVDDITNLKLKETIKERLFHSYSNLGVNAKQIEEKLKVKKEQKAAADQQPLPKEKKSEEKEVKKVEVIKETKTTAPLVKLTGMYPQLFGAASATPECSSPLPSPPSPLREIIKM